MLAGNHTGQRIRDLYDTIISDYNLVGKVSYIVTDNASNMKAAFKVSFPQSESSTSTQLPESDGEDDDEDESCDSENSEPDWLDNGDSSINEIKASRISCFAHSLQLAILKGLSETKSANSALARATRVSNTLHRSCSYKVSELLKYLNWVVFAYCRLKAGCLLCLFFA